MLVGTDLWKAVKDQVEPCRTSFTAARIGAHLICLVKVWAYGMHHPAHKFHA